MCFYIKNLKIKILIIKIEWHTETTIEKKRWNN